MNGSDDQVLVCGMCDGRYCEPERCSCECGRCHSEAIKKSGYFVSHETNSQGVIESSWLSTDEQRRVLPFTPAAVGALRDEVERLRTANEMMEAIIEDSYSKHDGKTCPRVQCRNAANSLQRELDALQVAYTEVCFETARQRPVVDAALALVARWHDTRMSHERADLRSAVDAYRASSDEEDS